MRVKICGITQAQQGKAIAALGATALGFICVERSPRYVRPQQIKAIVETLPPDVDKIGVFANTASETILQTVLTAKLTSVQLHGHETPEYCDRLRQILPSEIELIKAFRIKTAAILAELKPYLHRIDTILLDAYDPQMLGGTGKTLDWEDLEQFNPELPWLLAGGLTPENILDPLSRLNPDGIDLSSGVERSPGDKDLTKVTQLFEKLQAFN
ncbi:phosphoribosylanthranilate isomerase [Myxosarcina sp. GI1]|uniref:phosphoribosylanthranilate isomerase n=1 Tax=Myxosarcina sp. GI1 TaxID=1541065 RepID=UPI0005603360|nr:phosphoribosylanthranilate isomerase [Myxosarcina sp. GI1]